MISRSVKASYSVYIYDRGANRTTVVRIEWAKARARALRWTEEVNLLREEMCRIRVTLQARAEWWRLQGVPWEGLDPDMAEGVHAYALRQAKVYERLLQDFSELWLTPFTSKPKKRLPLPSSPEAADACEDESDDDLPPDTSGDPSIPNPDARRSPSPPAAVNSAANFPEILVTNTPLTIPEIPVTNTPLDIPEMTIEVGMAID